MRIHLHTKQGKLILFPARRIPPLAPKTVALFLSVLLICGSFFLLFPFSILVKLFIIDVGLFPVSILLVVGMKLPTSLYHEYKISKALVNLNNHTPMTVIGVTGSFGKTSTKEYLATILGSKYNVIKTEASKNSPIGIAETLLHKLVPENNVFVVEMGAYKQGEIARMTQMVKPQIGILTAINAQHQDLFGTIENTMKAKYELIAGLVGKRIAIINADNDKTSQMIDWARKDGCTVWVYTREKSRLRQDYGGQAKGVSRIFVADDIHATLEGISFTCMMGNLKEKVSVPVLGEHQVSNILAAMAGAVAAGMSLKDTAKAASGISSLDKTLKVIPGINGSIYINDTFNNNPDGAKAALAVLAKVQGRKILVFQPMIELGMYARESHKEVGIEAGRICDAIILTNDNFADDFIAGVHSSDPGKHVDILSPSKTAQFIHNTVKKGDGVLFKGKEAEFSFRLLMN